MRLQRNKCWKCVNNTYATKCPYQEHYVTATAVIDKFLVDHPSRTDWLGTLKGTCDYYVENPNLADKTSCGNGGC